MSDQQPTPLFSEDAERALIGAAIIDPAIIDQLDIDQSAFYLSKLALVWGGLRRVVQRGLTPDIITLSDELKSNGDLEKIGGVAYLAGLTDDTPSSLNYESYADTVKGYSLRRQALATANRIAKAAYNLQAPLQETVSEIMSEFTRAQVTSNGARHITAALKTLLDDVDYRVKNPTDTWGIATGFYDIDNLLGGLQPGEVMYIAGEPGAGKSKLSMQIGVQVSQAKVPTAIYSLEMKELAVIRRMVSGVAEVATRNLKTGKFKEGEYEKVFRAASEFEAWPLYMTDSSSWTLDSLHRDLWRMKQTYGVKVFILDYLLLMGGYDRLDESERASKLSSGIKALVRSLDLSAVTVNSVTKEGMDTATASMRHVKGSGQTIHDADVIAQLFKPDDKTGIANLVFTKTREAEQGARTIQLLAERNIPIFRNYTKRTPERVIYGINN